MFAGTTSAPRRLRQAPGILVVIQPDRRGSTLPRIPVASCNHEEAHQPLPTQNRQAGAWHAQSAHATAELPAKPLATDHISAWLESNHRGCDGTHGKLLR